MLRGFPTFRFPTQSYVQVSKRETGESKVGDIPCLLQGVPRYCHTAETYQVSLRDTTRKVGNILCLFNSVPTFRLPTKTPVQISQSETGARKLRDIPCLVYGVLT